MSPAPTVPDVPAEFLDDNVDEDVEPTQRVPDSVAPEPTGSAFVSLAPGSTHPKPPVVDLDGADAAEVPDIRDKAAPRFDVGEHHISQNAVRQRAKRIFTPRVDGSLKVSETIFKEWKGKGQARRNLEQIFKSVGYDPDP